MANHEFQIFTDSSTQRGVDFPSPNEVLSWRVLDEWEFRDERSDFLVNQRQVYEPRYAVEFDMFLSSIDYLTKARSVYELIRDGKKFQFAIDDTEKEKADLDVDIRIQDLPTNTIQVAVGDSLTVGKYYRMICDYGYYQPGLTYDTLEAAWPGYQNMHVFKVTVDLGSQQYTISPTIYVPFEADNTKIMSRGTFTSGLMLSNRFDEFWHEKIHGWIWTLKFALQNPPSLTDPAWS